MGSGGPEGRVMLPTTEARPWLSVTFAVIWRMVQGGSHRTTPLRFSITGVVVSRTVTVAFRWATFLAASSAQRSIP